MNQNDVNQYFTTKNLRELKLCI